MRLTDHVNCNALVVKRFGVTDTMYDYDVTFHLYERLVLVSISTETQP